ncbi:MAG: hypothetical protein L0215_01475 [Gemmataceae bacterium]|nr:hypothetical protein [Gemmataceae bacterium]
MPATLFGNRQANGFPIVELRREFYKQIRFQPELQITFKKDGLFKKRRKINLRLDKLGRVMFVRLTNEASFALNFRGHMQIPFQSGASRRRTGFLEFSSRWICQGRRSENLCGRNQIDQTASVEHHILHGDFHSLRRIRKQRLRK